MMMPRKSEKEDIRNAGSSESKAQNPAKWEKVCALVFGVVFIVVLLVLAVLIPYPTAFQELVFRVTLSAALAGIAAVIPGFLHVEVKGIVRASGAMAVFVLVFWFNPASVVTTQPRPEHVGKLGNLLEHLNNSPESQHRLILRDRKLLDFSTPEYAGESWSDVIDLICDDPRNSCLECDFGSQDDVRTVGIGIKGGSNGILNRGTEQKPSFGCK